MAVRTIKTFETRIQTIEQRKENFLREFMECKAIKSIAYHKAGIGKTTFFKWQNNDVAFSNAINEIEEKWLDVIESKLMDLALMNDRASIMFILKAKARKRGYY